MHITPSYCSGFTPKNEGLSYTSPLGRLVNASALCHMVYQLRVCFPPTNQDDQINKVGIDFAFSFVESKSMSMLPPILPQSRRPTNHLLYPTWPYRKSTLLLQPKGQLRRRLPTSLASQNGNWNARHVRDVDNGFWKLIANNVVLWAKLSIAKEIF